MWHLGQRIGIYTGLWWVNWKKGSFGRHRGRWGIILKCILKNKIKEYYSVFSTAH
jgi:hypothetical protein